ncbi:MAG: hypothetical protein M3Y24_07740 [Acidobacteriota bacterium]|nr:hypothetical protein [Acidobacteriota bacterium]
MNKLFTSTLLTVVAVPFLMASPTAPKKAQNQPAVSQNKVATAKKAHKKHVKKSQVKTTPAAATVNQK